MAALTATFFDGNVFFRQSSMTLVIDATILSASSSTKNEDENQPKTREKPPSDSAIISKFAPEYQNSFFDRVQ
jgi:hypothetical protein